MKGVSPCLADPVPGAVRCTGGGWRRRAGRRHRDRDPYPSRYAYTVVATAHTPGCTTSARRVPAAGS